jgi:hypothetical protein
MAKEATARMSGAQVIRVRFHGWTATKPSRYSAESEAGRKYYSKPEIENLPGAHAATVARIYATEMGWGGDWCGGWTGKEYVFVNVNQEA